MRAGGQYLKKKFYARNLRRSVLNNFPKFHGDWMNGVVMHKTQTDRQT